MIQSSYIKLKGQKMKKLNLMGILLGAALITGLSTTTLNADAKCGAGKCGGDKKTEAAGKCGGDKKAPAKAAGKCGGDKKAPAAGKCGGDKKAPANASGKCGVGKCG